MNREEILANLRATSGDPSGGPVAEWLPALADGLAAALHPAKIKDGKESKDYNPVTETR